MQRFELTQYSQHLNRDMHILVHGHDGLPILAFPTQDSLCDNYEGFGMIDTVADYIESGQIQFFTVDTIDRESWSDTFGDKGHRAWMQECYFRYIVEEALPYIMEVNALETTSEEKVLKVVVDSATPISKNVVVNILYATSQATIEKALAKLLKEGRIQLITKGRYSKYFRT